MRHVLLTTLALAALATLEPGRAGAQPADVNVTNPTQSPVRVQPQADSLPVFYTLTADFQPGEPFKNLTFSDLTPVGYYFIVDHVSVFASVPLGQQVWAAAKSFDPTRPPSLAGYTAVPLSHQGTTYTGVADDVPDGEIYDGNPSCSLYVAAGWQLRVNVIRNKSAGSGFAYATIQGHLARVPFSTPRQ